MNVLNKEITTAILSYIIVGDESLDPMLEELTNGGTQSRIPSSEAISVLQIAVTMPVDLRAKLVICAIPLGKMLPEVSLLCVFEPIIRGQGIPETQWFKYITEVEAIYTTRAFTWDSLVHSSSSIIIQ